MFVINEDNSIYVTRGDVVFFSVIAEDEGTNYVFQPGDVVRIKVYGRKDTENVVLQKDFAIFTATESVDIYLSEADTKFGDVISKPTDYWYEIELNPNTEPQTIIGYDEDGAKVFKLFPEGDDIPEYVPEPEVIKVIDDELDMTSTRPVQNQAIARAVAQLEAKHEATNSAAAQVGQAVAVERTRIDNLVGAAAAPISEDAAYLEVADVRVGADGIVYPSAGAAVREQFKDAAKVKNPYENTTLAFAKTAFNNMIDRSRMKHGYYVGTTGELTAGDVWNVTHPIPVTGLNKLYFSGGVGLACFYEVDGTFISYVQNGAEVAVPNNASYMIASVVDDYLGSAMIAKHKNLWYDPGCAVIGKKPYADGFITFTVPVNQTVADNTVSHAQASEGSEVLVDVECHLKLPVSYRPTGRPSKLLMICHGAGKGVAEWRAHEGYQAIVQKFNDRGYVVFDCNGFKNDALGWSFWGDQRGVEAWRKAYEYVVRNYNVEQTFSIYAFSMGGLTAMNLAFKNMPNINCIAMASPVLNLRACWDDTSMRAVLQTLYGMGNEWDEAKVAGSNPYKNIVTVNGEKYCFKNLPPIKIWYGSTEQAYGVDKRYAAEMVEAIINSGGYAEYREVNGAGHEICYGMNEYCNVDYLLFVERHNTCYDRTDIE